MDTVDQFFAGGGEEAKLVTVSLTAEGRPISFSWQIPRLRDSLATKLKKTMFLAQKSVLQNERLVVDGA